MKQKNRKKPPSFLPQARVNKLRKAFLHQKDYEELLTLWVEKGCLNWRRSKKTAVQSWRKGTVEVMRNRKDKWRDIFLVGVEWTKAKDQNEINSVLTEAREDPLMFLNFLGVSPWEILAEIEAQYHRKKAWEFVMGVIRSERSLKWYISFFESASEKVAPFELEFRDQIDEISPLPLRYWTSRRLKSMAQVLRGAKKNDLVPPWTYSRGAPPKEEFYRSVMGLRGICKSGISAGRKKNKRLSISVAQKASWGAITAILMAAFPNWFTRQENPVRNVRNAHKKAKKFYPLWIEI